MCNLEWSYEVQNIKEGLAEKYYIKVQLHAGFKTLTFGMAGSWSSN